MMPSRRRWLRLPRALTPFFLAALVASSGVVDAQGPILHEEVPEDPQEDLAFTATTIDGDLHAAVKTPSGIATAPDPRRPPDARPTYGGTTVDDSPDSTYEPDRDTRRPTVENYEDPFVPSTMPFKRLRAFDTVLDDYTLAVRDKTLRALPVGGALATNEEPFYGDFTVALVAGEPVRIPSVGPDARILRMHSNPEVDLDVVRDGADNWFVKAHVRKDVRLVVELGIVRQTFGSPFAEVRWQRLAPLVPPQPAAHRAAFQEVAKAIDISTSMSPREVVEKMVDYFRSFEPTDAPLRERADIYLDLALSKKGVCRHRSFAFLVTALNIGIPARMIVNEAHAWVEVYDGTIWHRVDLGGASANLQEEQPDPSRPMHTPPDDPYAWPENQDSGQELANRTRSTSGGGGQSSPNGTSSANTSDSAAPPSSAAPPPVPTSPPSTSIDPNATPAEISIASTGTEVRRGMPFKVSGQVKTSGAACAHVRVDVLLRSASAPAGVAVGSLSTNEQGAYDGAVVVPRELPLGEYDVIVRTPGGGRCGPGESL
ncbi:MAG TPA: transglutaminase-like domain-containing protein [Polyangium sp.]|nr:transglutaminase-like domain-containing protein [Polyangium sp.]